MRHLAIAIAFEMLVLKYKTGILSSLPGMIDRNDDHADISYCHLYRTSWSNFTKLSHKIGSFWNVCVGVCTGVRTYVHLVFRRIFVSWWNLFRKIIIVFKNTLFYGISGCAFRIFCFSVIGNIEYSNQIHEET